MQKRRWGGMKFYDHATVPPAPDWRTFRFNLYPATPTGEHGRFTVPQLVAQGVTVEEAYLKIVDSIPTGSRMWCWTEDP